MPDRAAADPVPSVTARQPRAIHSALAVLEVVAQHGAGVSAREVSEALGYPRATTYRLLNVLVQDEYLVRTPDLAGFALGAKVARLGAVAAPVRIPRAARDVLADVRDRVRGGVHLVLYSGTRVAAVEADPDFPLSDEALLRREPERFALGRLLLLDRGAAGRYAPAAAADVDRYGATRQIDELRPGYGCLAVPIRDVSGALAGAVGFSGVSARVADPEPVVALLAPVARALAPLVT